jgi:hypothetical protein
MKGVSSESAWLAWAILAVMINAFWIGYDIWASKTNHYTMTHEMQNWLHGALSGPLCFGILMFVVGAFLYHMLIRAAG